MPLQIRRGTEAERLLLSSPPVAGEMIWITDDFKLYIGDGNTLARDLPPVTGYGDGNARDAAASIFTAGTHSGISFAYDGSTAINATVSYPALLQNLSLNSFNIDGTGNINISGSITATSFVGDYKGSIAADDSTILVDAQNGSINLNGTVKGDIVPDGFDYNLGSPSNRFNAIFLSSTGLNVGSANVTSNGFSINLPEGSTIGGVPIASSELVSGTNHNINIIGDDSTIIVNVTDGSVTAPGGFLGNLTGNLAGNLVGFHTGDMKGSVFADDSSLLVDSVDRVLFGTVTAGATTYTDSAIITENTLSLGTQDEFIQNLEMYLGDNLQIRNVDPNGKGYITSTMSRGTHASPAAIQAGDEIGGILFRAYTDNSTVALSGIINFAIDPTAVIAGGSFVKSQLVMGAATDSDLDPANAFVLDSGGIVSSNAFNASKYFQLPVYVDDFRRDSDIPTPAPGMIIFMTAGTTPSGTNKMQLFDGSNWVNLN